MSQLDGAVQSLLNELERQEAQLLSWGVVDGGFTYDELVATAEKVISKQGLYIDEENLVEALEDRRLLFEFPSGYDAVFRTRMAETLRLLARLRQLFPRHLESGAWRTAPSLVSDFRFRLLPRRYPKRDIPLRSMAGGSGDSIESLVEDVVHLRPIQQRVLEQLLTPNDGEAYRLSRFQVDATAELLKYFDKARHSKGIIVCAGTGTGKTLAFYLPALMRIAQRAERGASWTKALALYPRKELLKDQFTEAYALARRADSVLTADRRRRKITVGAFYGDTPLFAWEEAVAEWAKWPPSDDGSGFVCPYLTCPKCDHAMVWARGDIKDRVERLNCENPQCDHVAQPDEIRLTRQRMAEEPPDIVFSTTEMVNQLMGDSEYGHVIGVGAKQAPEVVLLDEVHTYTGIHGAQVAYLLRRWRKAVRGCPHFVGLSATLAGAEQFFSRLTNIGVPSIRQIEPYGEMEEEGAEYQVALRGDPVSGASLLSASIQSAMLLRRALDPSFDAPSEGFYGKKVFAFTDDLDVTNRFYDDLDDAEGNREDNNRDSLASLRSALEEESDARLREGQSWRMCEEIGHTKGMAEGLTIERTSSQDAGVNPLADVVVATASLEVGFDDPEVGAVLQHKAPRDVASFLQRKGRAGRPREMRPWTVVVLSDYGRDRVAYQGYDQLFDPALQTRSLPIANRYVERMQAVFAFMDWVAQHTRNDLPEGSVWKDFAGPPDPEKLKNGKERQVNQRKRQKYFSKVVRLVLKDDALQRQVENYLQEALDLERDEVIALMWEPPRALMPTVLPTLLRRLENAWSQYGDQNREVTLWTPLPEFVPGALFSDLNLPEVQVFTPIVRSDDETHAMGIRQALQQFAPGRVSRRFGTYDYRDSHWVPLPSLGADDTQQTVDPTSFCNSFDDIGTFHYEDEAGDIIETRCLRPWRVETAQVPREIRTSSNARTTWRSQIAPSTDSSDRDWHEVSEQLDWHRLIPRVGFFVHNRTSSVQVRRFAIGSTAEISFQASEREDLRTEVRYQDESTGQPIALGFEQEVDGIVFHFCFPERLKVRPPEPSPEKMHALRTTYFRERVLTTELLSAQINRFQRDWLFQIMLAALTQQATMTGEGLEEASQTLVEDGLGDRLVEVLDVIFGAALDEEMDEVVRGRRQEELVVLCNTLDVQDALLHEARVLWEALGEAYDEWARARIKSTIGNALLEACHQLSPEMEGGDLYLDINPGVRPQSASEKPEGISEIWITESMVGGAGIVEALERLYTEDPRRFFTLVESALQASDFEVVDSELTRLVELGQKDEGVRDALQSVRDAKGISQTRAATEQLRATMAAKGLLGIHAVHAAVNARILRPGSTASTDSFVHQLLADWNRHERSLGIEIEARVFAYWASQQEAYRDLMPQINGGNADDAAWRFQVIYSLLWPRGYGVRQRALSTYNPFADLPEADRLLVADLLPLTQQVVEMHGEWMAKALKVLRERGTVIIQAEAAQRIDLKKALLALLGEPLEYGFLHLYARIAGIERSGDNICARVVLPEVLQ